MGSNSVRILAQQESAGDSLSLSPPPTLQQFLKYEKSLKYLMRLPYHYYLHFGRNELTLCIVSFFFTSFTERISQSEQANYIRLWKLNTVHCKPSQALSRARPFLLHCVELFALHLLRRLLFDLDAVLPPNGNIQISPKCFYWNVNSWIMGKHVPVNDLSYSVSYYVPMHTHTGTHGDTHP